MSRVLITSAEVHSSVRARLPVARSLVEKGHEVRWLFWGGEPNRIRELPGIPLMRLPSYRIFRTGEARASTDGFDIWKQIMFGAVRDEVREVADATASFDPEMVVADGAHYAAILFARRRGTPCIHLSSHIGMCQPAGFRSPANDWVARLAGERQELFDEVGWRPEFRTWEAVSDLLNIVFTTRELIAGVGEIPPNTELVGPSPQPSEPEVDADFPWDQLDPARPTVLVAFGTRIYWQPLLLDMFVKAASRLDVQLVLSTGDLVDRFKDAPSNVIARAFVPQMSLLKRCAAFVSHGGANSVNEALLNGVPTLVVPLSADQPVQAYLVERAGAGLAATKESMTAERAAELVTALLTTPSFRTHAQRIAASYQQHADGATRAAELIDHHLAQHRAP